MTQMHCHGFGIKSWCDHDHDYFTFNSKTFEFIIDMLVHKLNISNKHDIIHHRDEISHSRIQTLWLQLDQSAHHNMSELWLPSCRGQRWGLRHSFSSSWNKRPLCDNETNSHRIGFGMSLALRRKWHWRFVVLVYCCFSLHSSSSRNKSVIGSDSLGTMFSGGTAHLHGITLDGLIEPSIIPKIQFWQDTHDRVTKQPFSACATF